MPDPDNNKPVPSKPKEISMEQRLLIAFVLMGVVIFATQFLYNPTVPENPVKPVQQAKPQQAVKPAAPAPAATMSPGAIAASKEDLISLETNLYKIVFSNRGAVVHRWTLKKYKDGAGKELELVNAAAVSKVGYPLAVSFKGQSPRVDLNQALFVAKATGDGLGLDFEFSDGRTNAKKSLRFGRDSYLSQITSSVTDGGTQVPHLLAWRGGFGDATVVNPESLRRAFYYDTANSKLIENEGKTAKDGPVTVNGPFSFGGVEDAFFAAVFLPEGTASFDMQTLHDYVALTPGGKEEGAVGAAVGGDGTNRFSFFVGPKDVDLLRRVSPKLEQAVDFGWFSFLAKPLFLSLNWVNDRFVHNYGWSIILVTVIINFLLLPLKFTSMKSMKKMQTLQPQIAAINERYKNVGLRDPQKAEQNQEVMALYKKHGVSPAGGCVPLLLQIPFFIAFYKVLTVAIEMRGAQWLWVKDLSQFDVIYLLPILMAATQFVLQKMTPATSADPAQQKMMLFMPLMMMFFFFQASAGLVLYWLTGNVVGIAQQWFFNKISPAAAPAVIDVKPVVKKRSKT